MDRLVYFSDKNGELFWGNEFLYFPERMLLHEDRTYQRIEWEIRYPLEETDYFSEWDNVDHTI